MTMTQKHTKNNKVKKKNYNVYLRRFGLEFLEFLCQNHEVILYTYLETEITSAIIKSFQGLKSGINFAFIIWGKEFHKNIYGLLKPVKSLNKIIPWGGNKSGETTSEREYLKNKFLILDSDILSYYQNFEDIHVPILPIMIHDLQNSPDADSSSIRRSSKVHRLKGRMLHKRQSSLKNFSNNKEKFIVQEHLKNHCLFYLKQLLSQSFGGEYWNTELIRSVSISCLANN